MFALHDQSWLVAPPKDFTKISDQLRLASDDVSDQLRSLASCRLDLNQLTRLSGTIEALNSNNAKLSSLSNFNLGVVGQSTTSFISKSMPAGAARYGVNLRIVEAEYDQLAQSAFDPKSIINSSQLDAILISMDCRVLPFDQGVEAVKNFIRDIRRGFLKYSNTPIIFETLCAPPVSLLGSYDIINSGSLSASVAEINNFLVDIVEEYGDFILDIDKVAKIVGVQNWHNPIHWNSYKLSFAMEMVPVYVDAVGRLLGAIRGRSRKCIVLDLDNTLWGGVIGDDGLSGIILGQGDPLGEAFMDFQRLMLRYREHGIILAVCSKNEHDIALLPFRQHPDMVLKETDIAFFAANWDDKASNLKWIAAELNLGLDALVMVDDNPAERLQIRMALPEVAVPELPEDPSFFSSIIANSGYFEAVSFSDDDKQRAEQYRANAARKKNRNSASNLDEYLRSLDMHLNVGSFSQLSLPRVTQLANKTNQFNLTTRRYTQAEIEKLCTDPDIITLQGRLADQFGSNGLISIMIGRVSGSVCTIESWLMSCRVIGRKVEDAMLIVMSQLAVRSGATALAGEYIPTQKNALVADLYQRLGFSKISEGPDGVSNWYLDVSEEFFDSKHLPIEVHWDD